jgi:hypothetical protein
MKPTLHLVVALCCGLQPVQAQPKTPWPLLPQGYECKTSAEDYPVVAVRENAEGTVILKITVGADSKIDTVEVEQSAGEARGHKLLDRASVRRYLSCVYLGATPVPAGVYAGVVRWSLSAV